MCLLIALLPEVAVQKAEGSRHDFPPAPTQHPQKAVVSTKTGKGNDKVWESREC